MNIFDRIILYFRSSYAELKKVSWPSRKDTVRYSTLIVVVSVVVAVFFMVLDKGLQRGIETILANKHVTSAPQTGTQTVPAGTPDTSASPIDVQAVTPQGTPASVKVTPVPTTPATKK